VLIILSNLETVVQNIQTHISSCKELCIESNIFSNSTSSFALCNFDNQLFIISNDLFVPETIEIIFFHIIADILLSHNEILDISAHHLSTSFVSIKVLILFQFNTLSSNTLTNCSVVSSKASLGVNVSSDVSKIALANIDACSSLIE